MSDKRYFLPYRPVRRYALLLALVWTLAVIGSLVWNIYRHTENFKESAYNEAVAYLNQDNAFRLWVTSQTGLYASTDSTPPNPYLSFRSDRDVTTTSGKKLTMLSHAYILRQINEKYANLLGVFGHITSLKTVRPANAPDEWEKQALESFKSGVGEVREFIEMDGKPYLRLMRPVKAEKRCIKCHEQQGYSIGDMRGGVSINLPLSDRASLTSQLCINSYITHGLLWVIVLAFIGIGAHRLSKGLTDREMFESALRRSEQRYRRITAVVADYTYTVKVENGRAAEISHSPACVVVTGYSNKEFAATASLWLDIVHPEDRDSVLEYFEQLISGVKGSSIEYRIRHKNGETRYVVNHPLMHFNRHGKLLSYESLVRDITEQKKVELKLFQSQKMQSIATMAGGIAHDFNNLMTGVLGYAELLKKSLSGDPGKSRMLDTISTSARRAGDLAQQLLAYARGGKYQPKVMSLNDTIVETLDLQNHVFQPGIKIERTMEENLWHIKADPTQMQQVIMNLCINAVESMGHDGCLTISTQNVELDSRFAERHPGLKPGRHICLTVSDTGVGMKPEVRAKVFEPFFTTKMQGRGLGMSAVYGIVKNHSGHIAVSSMEGKGTTFRIYLPVAVEKAYVDKTVEAMSYTGTETVLVVDDEELVRSVSKMVLEKLGYKVMPVEGGNEALKLISNYDGDIDLVLLDMAMPEMSGTETFSELEKVRPGMKFIICSGYELDEDAQALLDRGAKAFLQKPFMPDELALLVRQTLDS